MQHIEGKSFSVREVEKEEEFFGGKLQNDFRQKEIIAVIEASDLYQEVEDLDYFSLTPLSCRKEKRLKERNFWTFFLAWAMNARN